MPQIANQDYNIVNAMPGIYDMSNDAHIFGELKRHFLQGTIFDVIVLDNVPMYRRIIAVTARGDEFGVAGTDEIKVIGVTDYSVEQYEGLAAIQQAAIAVGIEVTRIPVLHYATSELGAMVDAEAGPIVDEDGKVYNVTFEDGKITAVQKTQHAPESTTWDGDALAVSFEDVQKLIGLPIAEY